MTENVRDMVATRCLKIGTSVVEFNSPGMG